MDFSGWLRRAAVVGPAALLAACVVAPPPAPSVPSAPPAPNVVIGGSATYRERIALPADAVFEATVENVARADATSTVVGRVRIASPQVPVRFSIPVDATQAARPGRYVVRARILLGDRLLFTSDVAHEVLGPADVRSVDILLRRVGEPPRRLRGLYRYQADAATFADCTSGERLRVAEEGANAALQRAYLAVRPAPGAAVLVEVEGRVEPRPAGEPGGAARPALVVERVLSVAAGSCPPGPAPVPLQGTEWTLVELDGEPVAVPARARTPHLLLQASPPRVSGHAGCNRFSGSYRLEGERLSFGRTAATRMACVEGMDLERRFLAALTATMRWRIEGGQLELVDARGRSLARFDAANRR